MGGEVTPFAQLRVGLGALLPHFFFFFLHAASSARFALVLIFGETCGYVLLCCVVFCVVVLEVSFFIPVPIYRPTN